MAAVPSIGRASLVELPARSAQAAATEGLYERHSAKILGYCMHQLGSREEAEDAVQTTFMNAFRALGRGVVPESESAWLFKIAENVCLSRRRSSWRRGRIESPSDFDVIEEIVPGPTRQRDELIGIEDALASMPDQQRRAILLREWQGLSYREIAEELEVSQSAVETLIFRARRSLAQGLEEPERKRKPRKGLRRALHVLDFGTLVAAAKTLLAGSAAAQATAAAVAVTAVAGTAATVKNEGHSPRPAEARPAAVVPAAKPAAKPVRASAPADVAPADVAAPSPAVASRLVPRSRPAVLTPIRKAAREKAAAPKRAASAPAPAHVVPATPPAVAVAPPAQPVAPPPPVAPAPGPIAQPEPTQPPVVVAPPAPVDAQPLPGTNERKTREERRQERQERREERRNGGRQVSAEPQKPAPSAVVAVVPTPVPAPPVPAVAPAEPEQPQRDRRRGKWWQPPIVAPAAIVQQTTADPAVTDPAVPPAAEPAEEPERRGRRGRRP